MKIYFVLYLIMAMIAPTQTRLAGARGEKGRIGPPGPSTPYCRVSSKITNFLKQFHLKRRWRSRVKSNNWVYNCLHVGVNYQQSTFELSTFQCCQQCRFPAFHYCLTKYTQFMAESRCNSEAIRCIARCINNKGSTAGKPGPTGGRPGPPGPPGRPGPPGPKGSRCPVKRKRVGGSYCLERSCIPI